MLKFSKAEKWDASHTIIEYAPAEVKHGEETAEELIDALRGKGMDDGKIAALLESALKEVKPKPEGDGDERKRAEDLFGMKFAE